MGPGTAGLTQMPCTMPSSLAKPCHGDERMCSTMACWRVCQGSLFAHLQVDTPSISSHQVFPKSTKHLFTFVIMFFSPFRRPFQPKKSNNMFEKQHIPSRNFPRNFEVFPPQTKCGKSNRPRGSDPKTGLIWVILSHPGPTRSGLAEAEAVDAPQHFDLGGFLWSLRVAWHTERLNNKNLFS